MIHMTATTMSGGKYYVRCRCPWKDGPYETLNQARKAGDEHLKRENAVESI